eukprot:COSAG03_NODE_1039_length_4981_cov_17.479721_2_plen_204_part_00
MEEGSRDTGGSNLRTPTAGDWGIRHGIRRPAAGAGGPMSMTYEGGTYEGRRRGPRGTPDIRRCVRMQLLHGTARTRRRSSRSEMAPLALAVLAVVATQAHGLNNGFNKPQLGWNSWMDRRAVGQLLKGVERGAGSTCAPVSQDIKADSRPLNEIIANQRMISGFLRALGARHDACMSVIILEMRISTHVLIHGDDVHFFSIYE